MPKILRLGGYAYCNFKIHFCNHHTMLRRYAKKKLKKKHSESLQIRILSLSG